MASRKADRRNKKIQRILDRKQDERDRRSDKRKFQRDAFACPPCAKTPSQPTAVAEPVQPPASKAFKRFRDKQVRDSDSMLSAFHMDDVAEETIEGRNGTLERTEETIDATEEYPNPITGLRTEDEFRASWEKEQGES